MGHPDEPHGPASSGPAGGGEEKIGCREARRSLAVFCRGRLEPEEERLFRGHLTGCGECRGLYRETLGGLARLGREKRARRRERRRRENREMAVRAAVESRPRRFGLRLVLVPALLIGALGWLRPFASDSGLAMGVSAGRVRVAAEVHGVEDGELPLERGQWCELDETARATLAGPRVEIRVEPSSYFLVEEPEPARLRLKSGGLELEGHGRITSPWGVLDCEGGRARLELREGTLELACLSGTVAWTSPDGRYDLRAGETLGRDGILGPARL